MTTYVRTVQLRHSLVHRAVFTDPNGALVGHDERGLQLRPVAPEEQEAFGRSVLRASQLVLDTLPEERIEADMARPVAAGHYVLDVPMLRARSPWPNTPCADLIVQLRDRPGQELRGSLEHAPDEIASIDPGAPPTWLA